MEDISHPVAAVLVYYAMQPMTITSAAIGANTSKPGCDSFVDPVMSAAITEWIVPAVLLTAMLVTLAPYKWRSRILTVCAVPLAIFYTRYSTTPAPSLRCFSLTLAQRHHHSVPNHPDIHVCRLGKQPRCPEQLDSHVCTTGR